VDPGDEKESSVAPLCPLQYAASRIEECPGPRCPFWVGPSGKKGGCAVTLAGIDLERSPETVAALLKLRRVLDHGGVDEGRSLFYLLESRWPRSRGR
jgi:hypothetical protein